MHHVILYGDGAPAATLPLCRALNACGGVRLLQAGGIADYSAATPAFLLSEVARLDTLHLQSAVLLLREECPPLPCIAPDCRLVAAAEDGNAAAMRLCHARQIPLVTYGMRDACDISPSSLSGSRLSLSVRRPLPLLPCGTLDPCELTVDAPPAFFRAPFLPVCTVLILCRQMREGVLQIRPQDRQI